MTNRGVLGFRRLTKRGPLTFSQEDGNLSTDEIEDMVLDIIEEEDLDSNNPTEEDLELVVQELSRMIFSDSDMLDMPGPGGLPKPIAFQICMDSEWVNDWESGMRRITTELASEYESLIVKANGCEGVVNSDSPLAVQLIFQDRCARCRLKWLTKR